MALVNQGLIAPDAPKDNEVVQTVDLE